MHTLENGGAQQTDLKLYKDNDIQNQNSNKSS
jgi:hypothetical protein